MCETTQVENETWSFFKNIDKITEKQSKVILIKKTDSIIQEIKNMAKNANLEPIH